MAIWLSVRKWVIGAAAAISAVVGIYLYGRSSGALREAQKAAEKDRKNARRIEDAADKARTVDGDPVERLRKHKQLRD
jgi:hypothetical protein